MTKGKTKKVGELLVQKVDSETGEITHQSIEKKFVTEVKSDNFFMCFFDNLGPFLGLKNAKDKNLIACMCKIADFNTGVVHMTKKVREDLCKDAGISVTNISRHLKRLDDAGLIAEDRGDYTINPDVFWKGSMKTRTEVLESGGMVFQVRFVEPGVAVRVASDGVK